MSDQHAELTRLQARLELMTGIAEALIESMRHVEHGVTRAIEEGANSEILQKVLQLAHTITSTYDKYAEEVRNV